jgi:predicted outer membrane repeat protein
LGISSFTTITGLTSGSGPTLKNLVTVAGDGPSSNFSVFTVNSGVTGAAIANLNITNGNNYNGGAINNSGTLTVSASTLANNSACNGGGIANSGALTVNNSTLSGNYGGGYVTGCGNGGGGIYALSGSLILNGSTLSANTSGPGGALLANGGTVMVINSTFSGNSALAGKYGGAIFINAASVTLNDSTFSGNSAAGGGAIYNDGTLAVTDSILSGDTGGECGSGSGGAAPQTVPTAIS